MVRPPGSTSGIRVPTSAADDPVEATPLPTPFGPSPGPPTPTASGPGGGLLAARRHANRRFARLPAGVACGVVGVPGAVDATPHRRVVLMGGGAEDDGASRRFVEGAGGGDVVVLRASGSTSSYNDYFFEDVGADPKPGAVTSLRIDESDAGGDAAVVGRVEGAGAVWLAGGDQHKYLTWPEPLLAALDGVSDGRTIGGTSAGAMSLGAFSFDAAEGGIRFRTALREPRDAAVSVRRSAFGQPELADVLVDTHFSEREREGRLIAFLARVRQDFGIDAPRGIGIDEGTALIVDGDHFEVRGRGDVFVYALSGDVDSSGALDVECVLRIRLSDGDRGAWPVDLSNATELFVEGGRVRRR
ncbi:MAG: cyanophycinase [Deltaproteobacteria bacterium]